MGLSTEDKRESLEWMSKKLLSGQAEADFTECNIDMWLTVRFFEGEDGKMWKRNVQEVRMLRRELFVL